MKPWLAPFLLLLATSCALRTTIPAGFAAFPAKADRQIAMSPDDLLWRVRKFSDQPQAPLEFWRKALRIDLAGKGHLLVDSFSLSWDGHPAWGYETRRTVDGQESSYFVAVSSSKATVVVADAGGPSPAFLQRRTAMRIALDSLRLP